MLILGLENAVAAGGTLTVICPVLIINLRSVKNQRGDIKWDRRRTGGF